MPSEKHLLTGPYGSALRDRVLADARPQPSALWIAPTPLARAQVLAKLGRKTPVGRAPRVWCWDDLWMAVRDGVDDGPAPLSVAAARAAFAAAIGLARRAGELPGDSPLLAWIGARRRLRARFARWTALERPAGGDPPEDAGGDRAGWAVYKHYRTLLERLGAEDEPGLAVWASKALLKSPPDGLKRLGEVTVLDQGHETRAVLRALTHFESTAKSVRVTLGHDDEPALAEVFEGAAGRRSRLVDRGYVETRSETDPSRAPALRAVEAELFRDDAHIRPPLNDLSGLTLIGAPRGEGVGQVVAREVRRRLAEGSAPEDVLVLVRNWDDEADLVGEVARAWGLPVSPFGLPRPLSSEPAVLALLTALSLPLVDWDTAELVRLIRHGRFRPGRGPGRTAAARARAASILRDLPVYRGRDPLREALRRRIVSAKGGEDRDSAIATRDLVDTLIHETEVANQPGTWPEHLARIGRLAGSLGLGADGEGEGENDDGLDSFWRAFADHAAVAEASGAGALEYTEVVPALRELAGDVMTVPGAVEPGTVVMTTVERAAGARARHVIVANLAEGTFPSRAAVEEAEDAADPSRPGSAFASEMARFLGVLGSADHSVTLVYPSCDEKGQDVLPAGFLDEVLRRLGPGSAGRAHEYDRRFHPALIDRPDLAGSPPDERVRAVALACLDHNHGALARLAADPRHRTALLGSAAALRLAAHRHHGGGFDAYDGRLDGGETGPALSRRFPESYTFSPSQLESYLFCRFQFFMKYVLSVKPPGDRDEFDEDYVARGNLIHQQLDDLERRRREEGSDLLTLVDVVVRDEMRVELTDVSEADPGRNAIERIRGERLFRQYAAQAVEYERAAEGTPAPKAVGGELEFGDDPPLVIGKGPGAVRLRGTIDRVDLLVTEDGPRFRVIDYKTGSCPSEKEVVGLEMVQLPIYALAVEELGLAGPGATLADVGYWALRGKGYKAIDLGDWSAARVRLEETVVSLVARLRDGQFEINPRKDDCTRYCDYKVVCRIGQVRQARKTVGDQGS